MLSCYRHYAERIAPHVTDTTVLIEEMIKRGDNVLFEGAQGTMLDIDHGTYPYVTSSHPIAGGACIGAGVGPTLIDRVIGVVKCYTTRVGDGPFPTELTDATGEFIRRSGHEYGLCALALTRLDTLAGLDKVRICVGYRYQGHTLTVFPHSLKVLARCEPVYEELGGWEPFGGASRWEDLPEAARRYVEAVGELSGLPVAMVSTGRERVQTLQFIDIFQPGSSGGGPCLSKSDRL